MGRTHYVTLPAGEYAALQRIIGIACTTAKQIPGMYASETAVLRAALADYEKNWNGKSGS